MPSFLTACEHTYIKEENPPPSLRSLIHLTTSTCIRLSIGTAKLYGAYAIVIGAEWAGIGCEEMACDSHHIYAPPSTLHTFLPHILTRTLRWYIETL